MITKVPFSPDILCLVQLPTLSISEFSKPFIFFYLLKNLPFFTLHAVYGLNVVSTPTTTPSLYVEILTPDVMILGGEALGRWLGHESGVLMNGIYCPYKRGPREFLNTPLCEGTMKREKFAIPKGILTRPWPCWHPDLRFQPLELWGINFCCL